jgi:hypothetical protein
VTLWSGEPHASGRDRYVRDAAFIPQPDARRLAARREPAFRFVYEPLLDWLDGVSYRGAMYEYEVRNGEARRLRRP